MPSFLFADDAPEKQEVTRQFFKWLAIRPDKLYISELVLAELNRASPVVRDKLLEAVARRGSQWKIFPSAMRQWIWPGDMWPMW